MKVEIQEDGRTIGYAFRPAGQVLKGLFPAPAPTKTLHGYPVKRKCNGCSKRRVLQTFDWEPEFPGQTTSELCAECRKGLR